MVCAAKLARIFCSMRGDICNIFPVLFRREERHINLEPPQCERLASTELWFNKLLRSGLQSTNVRSQGPQDKFDREPTGGRFAYHGAGRPAGNRNCRDWWPVRNVRGDGGATAYAVLGGDHRGI